MKRKNETWQETAASLLLAVLLFLLPAVFVEPREDEPLVGAEELPQFTESCEKKEGEQRIRVLTGTGVVEMGLSEYLCGVVRAEMPASFPAEALKAQAVAARTYTLHKLKQGDGHPDADICTDYRCCQAWKSEAEARTAWGGSAQIYEQAVENAVAATDGQILIYGGEPILAVFHAASAGQTRAAGAVWQRDVPYLRSVASPEQGDSIPNYYSRAEFTENEFREKMAPLHPRLTGEMKNWLRNPVRDSAGTVETVEIGGVTVKGTTVRELLGLRSACFTWEVQGEKLVFLVTGHGHGVGMSQYGARQMAVDGADYREILTHYYVGAELKDLSELRGQNSSPP